MKDFLKKKQGEGKTALNPLAAGVAGAVIGAGVVAAGTAVFRNKKNREKVKGILVNAKGQAIEYIEDLRNSTKSKKKNVKEKLVNGKKEVKKISSSAKKTAAQTVKSVTK